MRFVSNIFASLIKPIDRRAFNQSIERHDADAYGKSFGSWDHLLALVYAQLSGAGSLRALETAWNANAHGHYHLGAGPIRRSTLADANHRRPCAVFAETFERLSALLCRRLAHEGRAMVRLIDSSPIPLDTSFAWAKSNGRIHGLKLHVVYDPKSDHPRRIDITPARVNDIEIGKQTPIEKGATYVFDKAYCSFAWWAEIDAAGAVFLTRLKDNARIKKVGSRRIASPQGEGFLVLKDDIVAFTGSKARCFDVRMRRIVVKREADGKRLTLITNDLRRSARSIAMLYKSRWQVELLFRWLKQHLRLKAFLGRTETAVRLQILAAMIAFVLLRLAQRLSRPGMASLRFAELVGQSLFQRKPMARIDKPPEINPSKPAPRPCPAQMELFHA
jgi:putative transposase